MKILILTAYDTEIQNFSALTDISKYEYCKKWGFDFITHKIKNRTGVHPSWQKLQIIIDYLKPNFYDYIVWLDSDIIITNYTFDIRTLFDNKYALTFPEDWCSPEGYNPKADMFSACSIIVNCKNPLSLEIFSESNKKTEFQNFGCWDQDALRITINENEQYNSVVHRVPRRILNAVDPEVGTIAPGRPHASEPWQYGDFLVHLTGLGDYQKNRIPKVKYYMEKRIC
jgi:hypothetical protein